MLDIAVFDNGQGSELFDVETDMWSKLPSMNRNRAYYPGVVTIQRIAGHRIYVVGGYDDAGEMLNSCEFLDVGESQWTLLEATMTTSRCFTCAVLLDHTTAVICGGDDGREILASCERLDLTTHTFSPFPDMLEPRRGHAGVHYNGTIVVIAGSRLHGCTCEQFDPAAFKWTPFAPLNEGRQCFGAAVVEGKIYAAGGQDDIEVYDGSVWSTVTQLPQSHRRPWTVALGGKLVVIGDSCDEVDIFDPDTDSWSRLSKRPQYRYHNTAVSF